MRHTRIDEFLFDWEPYYSLSPEARCVWLALYIGPTAKAYPVGILRVNVSGFGEECRMGAVSVGNAIQEMVDKGTIIHDRESRVVMLSSLPDKGERPHNGKVVHAFWKRWGNLPECKLKYRYPRLLLWLIGTISTENYQRAWNETFGTLPETVYDIVYDTVYDTVCDTVCQSTDSINNGKVQTPVDNLRVSPQIPMFAGLKNTVSHTVSHTVSGSTSRPPGNTVHGTLGITEKQGPDRARGRGASPPSAQPFTVGELLEAVGPGSGGRVVTEPLDERTGMALWELVELCGGAKVTLDDAKLVGRHLAAGHIGYRTDLDAQWLARSGVFLGLVGHARKWSQDGERKICPPGRQTSESDGGMTAEDVANRAKRLRAQGL